MPRFPACEHCVFFVRSGSSRNRGKCRRFPPILYYDVRANQPTELWPSVNDNWWCGEFRRPKIEAPSLLTMRGQYSRVLSKTFRRSLRRPSR